MSRDEIQKVKTGLESEMRGQQAKAQALLKEMESCKVRIAELRGGIASCAAILAEAGAANGHTDEKQLVGAPD